jgi:hypothetical protein
MSGTGVVRFLLRLPQELYEALQVVAEREHRSINGQIVHILERFIAEAREEGIGEGKVAA